MEFDLNGDGDIGEKKRVCVCVGVVCTPRQAAVSSSAVPCEQAKVQPQLITQGSGMGAWGTGWQKEGTLLSHHQISCP